MRTKREFPDTGEALPLPFLLTEEEQDFLVFHFFRYALGRHSRMVSYAIDFAAENVTLLKRETIRQMIDKIEEYEVWAERYEFLGLDEKDWRKLSRLLSEEEKRPRQRGTLVAKGYANVLFAAVLRDLCQCGCEEREALKALLVRNLALLSDGDVRWIQSDLSEELSWGREGQRYPEIRDHWEWWWSIRRLVEDEAKRRRLI